MTHIKGGGGGVNLGGGGGCIVINCSSVGQNKHGRLVTYLFR